MLSRRVPLILDVLLAALSLLWLAGGTTWHGRPILTHGADPRRAALILAGLAAWRWPSLWNESVFLRAARAFWRWLETRRGRREALFCAFVVASVIGCLQALALRVPMYDVGLFQQILWALAHGHGFVSTISGAGNFLLDHSAVSLGLLLPAYWLGLSSPLLLPVIQPALLFGGAAAWVWLAERLSEHRGRGPALAAAATLFGLCFDSLWGSLHWGFHENSIAFAALSWAFALAVARPRRWRRGTFALLCVAAASKEILCVDVALAFGAWAALEWKESPRRSTGYLLAALGCVAFFVWFERLPHPADKNYFDRYYMYLGHGLGSFFRTLLLSPWEVVRNVGAGSLARYALTVLLPWLGLPLVAWRWARRESAWLVAVLPSLASAALSTFAPLRQSGYHYVLELWPALAAVTIAVLAHLPSPVSARRFAVAWALLGLLAWDHDPWGDLREYAQGARAQAPVREAFARVPAIDSVSADELSGTWLANRLEITRWAALEPFGGHCPQWLILRGSEQVEQARKLCGPQGATQQVGDWSFIHLSGL